MMGVATALGKFLEELKLRLPNLVPTQNTGLHGFGRAVIWGLNRLRGDAVVIMMADESDDVRDVTSGPGTCSMKDMTAFREPFCAGVEE